MNKNFVDFMKPYTDINLAVAVSGGVDSMVLMHWCAELGLRPVVLTIDHGLRPESADEVLAVKSAAKNLGLECVVKHWIGAKPASGIEAAARDARYDVFLQYCRDNNIDALLIAHQADDQIETFLMNLSRGSGVYGLAGIRAEMVRDGVKILRPLLAVPRAELESYCKTNKINYFYDTMNEDENFTRVKIRKNRHMLRDRLGISDDRILSAIDCLGRVRDMLERMVDAHVDAVVSANPWSDAGNLRAIFGAEILFAMPDEVQLKFISRLVQKIGGAQYPPRLENICRAKDMLARDAKFTIGHCVVRRLHDKIVIAREGDRASFKNKRKEKKNASK